MKLEAYNKVGVDVLDDDLVLRVLFRKGAGECGQEGLGARIGCEHWRRD